MRADRNPSDGEGRAPNLAQELKAVSGLNVVTLARVSGVSRTRFHTWLREGGVGADKVPHLRSLIALFRQLRPLLGDDLQGFVRSRSAAGPIDELLREGETQTVVELALNPSIMPGEAYTRPYPVTNGGDLPGWIRPTRRLAWVTTDVGAKQRQRTLDDYGVSWRGPDRYVSGADETDHDHPIGATVHVVYER